MHQFPFILVLDDKEVLDAYRTRNIANQRKSRYKETNRLKIMDIRKSKKGKDLFDSAFPDK